MSEEMSPVRIPVAGTTGPVGVLSSSLEQAVKILPKIARLNTNFFILMVVLLFKFLPQRLAFGLQKSLSRYYRIFIKNHLNCKFNVTVFTISLNGKWCWAFGFYHGCRDLFAWNL